MSGADIPATIDGVAVTGIGDYAFNWCMSMTSVTIPESVTSIVCDSSYKTALYDSEENRTGNVLYIDSWLIKANNALEGEYPKIQRQSGA